MEGEITYGIIDERKKTPGIYSPSSPGGPSEITLPDNGGQIFTKGKFDVAVKDRSGKIHRFNDAAEVYLEPKR